MNIDDILNPVHAESRRAAEGMAECDHAISILDDHLARLRATGTEPREIRGASYAKSFQEGRAAAIKEWSDKFDPVMYKTAWLESRTGAEFLAGVHREAIRVELEKRYKETEDRLAKAMASLEKTVRAFVATGFLLGWGTYGIFRPVSDATASLVGQAKGAAVHADHPGRVRQGATPYRAGLLAERDLWLRPLEEIS